MIGFVIWIIGLILTFRAAIEIWNINAAVEKRLIAIVLIVLTSWLGLLFYYFYGKERMAGSSVCISIFLRNPTVHQFLMFFHPLTGSLSFRCLRLFQSSH